ncbi:MAG: glycosyltransferase [Bacillota bacterium]
MNPIRIGFVLLSNSRNPAPSTRIAALNMFPFLKAAGYDPEILFEPADATETPELPDLVKQAVDREIRVVLFQKAHGPAVERAARRLALAGIKTVYSVCDLVDVAMVRCTDATVVVTDYLKSLYPASLQKKIHVVHDGIEHPEQQVGPARQIYGSRRDRLRAVLVTSADLTTLPVIGTPPDWLEVIIVGRYAPGWPQRVREARWKFTGMATTTERIDYLRFLSSRRIHCKAWDPVSVYTAMRSADFGIIPIDTRSSSCDEIIPAWKVKSENRLTMKMCMGLPVIATPIPSYEPVLRHGENGFFARSQRKWIECLHAMRDPSVRERIGKCARESVLQRYSTEEQASRLLGVLNVLFETSTGTGTG